MSNTRLIFLEIPHCHWLPRSAQPSVNRPYLNQYNSEFVDLKAKILSALWAICHKNFVIFGLLLHCGSNFKFGVCSGLQLVVFCPTILLPKGVFLVQIFTTSSHTSTLHTSYQFISLHQPKSSERSKFYSKPILKHHHNAYLDQVLRRKWFNRHPLRF